MKKRIRIKTHRMLYRDFREQTKLQTGVRVLASGTVTLSSSGGSASTTVHSLPTRLASYSSPITGFRVGHHTYYIDNSIPADKRREYIKQAQRLRK